MNVIENLSKEQWTVITPTDEKWSLLELIQGAMGVGEKGMFFIEEIDERLSELNDETEENIKEIRNEHRAYAHLISILPLLYHACLNAYKVLGDLEPAHLNMNQEELLTTFDKRLDEVYDILEDVLNKA